MTGYGLSIFGLVYMLAVATPGPGVAAVIARSLGHGLRGAPAFIAGFLVGAFAVRHRILSAIGSLGHHPGPAPAPAPAQAATRTITPATS